LFDVNFNLRETFHLTTEWKEKGLQDVDWNLWRVMLELGHPSDNFAVNEHPEFEYGEKSHRSRSGLPFIVSQRDINIIF